MSQSHRALTSEHESCRILPKEDLAPYWEDFEGHCSRFRPGEGPGTAQSVCVCVRGEDRSGASVPSSDCTEERPHRRPLCEGTDIERVTPLPPTDSRIEVIDEFSKPAPQEAQSEARAEILRLTAHHPAESLLTGSKLQSAEANPGSKRVLSTTSSVSRELRLIA